MHVTSPEEKRMRVCAATRVRGETRGEARRQALAGGGAHLGIERVIGGGAARRLQVHQPCEEGASRGR
eukprot:433985-Prymnesium_polylepis.1